MLKQCCYSIVCTAFKKCVNPFVHNVPFLYLLKTSEILTAFWCFQGVEKACIGNEWVKTFSFLFEVLLSIHFQEKGDFCQQFKNTSNTDQYCSGLVRGLANLTI